MRGLGTDHVISGPMKGLKTTASDGVNKQTDRRTKNPKKEEEKEMEGTWYRVQGTQVFQPPCHCLSEISISGDLSSLMII